MWQKKSTIKVIPVNSAVDILLSNHPKMDDLLVAYENQTTGSLWKIIQTSQTDRVRFGAVLALRLCHGKNLVFWIGGRPAPVLPVCGLQSQKQFSRWFSLVRDSFRNPVINIPLVCFV